MHLYFITVIICIPVVFLYSGGPFHCCYFCKFLKYFCQLLKMNIYTRDRPTTKSLPMLSLHPS